MSLDKIEIIDYTTLDHAELLRLLLELQSSYFDQSSSPELREVRQDRNVKKSYEDYINYVEKIKDDSWKIFLAKSNSGKFVGFIIGSIETDEDMVLGKMGKIEDWFVGEQLRGKGIGKELYNKLEKWFREKGCQQVLSETWYGNELSIDAHQRMGFFKSGIMFAKKL